MMPGETHPAAPGPADLARCQGCASLQQVRGSVADPFALFWGWVPVLCLIPDARIGSAAAMLAADRASVLFRSPSRLPASGFAGPSWVGGWTLCKRGGNLPLWDEGLLALLIICCLKARVLCFMLRARVTRLQDLGGAFQLTYIY